MRNHPLRTLLLVALIGLTDHHAAMGHQASDAEAKEAMAAMGPAFAAFDRELEEAKAAYEKNFYAAREKLIKKLDDLKIDASKAVKVEKAAAILERIKKVKTMDPPSKDADTRSTKKTANAKAENSRPARSDSQLLAEAIVGSSWDRPHRGRITFLPNGFIKQANQDEHPWRWAAVDADTVIATYDSLIIDVFKFNQNRDYITSYSMGLITHKQPAWTAPRIRAD
jgi:hypothetical protein